MYTDEDPDYRDKPLVSPIPPPSAETVPRLQQRNNHHTRGSYQHHGRDRREGRYNQQQPQQQPQQQHHPERSRSQQYQQQQPQHQYSNEHNLVSKGESSTQAVPPPKVKPVPPVDIRMNTEFLECPDNQRDFQHVKAAFGMQTGRKDSIDLDTFCSASLVQSLITAKKQFISITTEQFSNARSRSNPFERTGRSIFMNRAAVKLAAIDAIFGLTSLSTEKGKEGLIFADLCGGPGGFSEYLLWRSHTWGSPSKGYGITLKSTPDLDWALKQFHPDTDVAKSFEALDLVGDGTGDLYKRENIQGFVKTVKEKTGSKGVKLVVADGGLSYDEKEEIQEDLSWRLVMCQIITAIGCLSLGGTFVCKFFDIFHPHTAGLVWLLHRSFESICITKPPVSRPANSERYIVCRNFFLPLVDRATLYNYLLTVNDKLGELEISTGGQEVVDIVKLDSMKEDEAFMDYLKMNNFKLAIKQQESLSLLWKCLKDPDFRPSMNQEEVRKRCFAEWRLPLE